jgi:hypothetical protein
MYRTPAEMSKIGKKYELGVCCRLHPKRFHVSSVCCFENDSYSLFSFIALSVLHDVPFPDTFIYLSICRSVNLE